MLPPWPGWDGLHPLVIHFPIALLLVAPLFVLLAVVLPKHAQALSASALLLLALGTVSAVVSVETGEAAGELVEHSEAVDAVLLEHAELAETTRNVFAALTLLYAAVLGVPLVVRKLGQPKFRLATNLVMLVLLAAASLLVVNTGHLGGRLVHELGVRAIMPVTGAAAPSVR